MFRFILRYRRIPIDKDRCINHEYRGFSMTVTFTRLSVFLIPLHEFQKATLAETNLNFHPKKEVSLTHPLSTTRYLLSQLQKLSPLVYNNWKVYDQIIYIWDFFWQFSALEFIYIQFSLETRVLKHM